MSESGSLRSHSSSLVSTGLHKRFGRKVVVKDVALRLQQGEIVGLLGPNGAGKTTIFNMLTGAVKPTGGSVFLDEDDITRDPMYIRARKGLNYLPQEPSIFRKLTVRENILAILELRISNSAERKARAAELLDEMGIGNLAGNMAYTLSGGERRRVEICRALVVEPKFILLDEPFAGIDPMAVMDIQSVIRSLKDRGIGVITTDHNVRETLLVCDRAYIIHEGEILAEGNPDEIASSEPARRSYLGETFRL